MSHTSLGQATCRWFPSEFVEDSEISVVMYEGEVTRVLCPILGHGRRCLSDNMPRGRHHCYIWSTDLPVTGVDDTNPSAEDEKEGEG